MLNIHEGLRKVWQGKEISIQTTTRLLSVCVMSVLLYAAETWTFKKNDMNRIRSFETKCLRKILNIKWQQKTKNRDIMKRTGTGINITQRMIERKMNFFGHICRMQDERLIKQVIFGIMDGKNKRGRPKRRWTDDLADWCNKDICTAGVHRVFTGSAARFQRWQRDWNRDQCATVAQLRTGHASQTLWSIHLRAQWL